MNDTQVPVSRIRAISIICVYNDADVRRECLDASIEAYDGPVDVDYVPIDNTRHAFASAGAALNHGVRLARHDVIAFPHQDVYLNSIDRVARAGDMLGDAWGVLGANGVAADGENTGRIQDRAQLIGRSAEDPIEVDSVDEVLFMATKQMLLENPLSEDPELAWHAYAVEYGLRLRRLGLGVGAVNMGATHNSLTVNLAKLDVAHRSVERTYAEFLPIHTTCGTIGAATSRLRRVPVIRRHGWRLRWLRHSLVAHRVRRELDLPVVLSDIRHEIDLLDFSADRPLYLFNLDAVGGFVEYADRTLKLTRYGRPVLMTTVRSAQDVAPLLDQVPEEALVLIIGWTLADLGTFRSRCRRDDSWLVGIHPDTLWLLRARDVATPEEWSRPTAVPLGFKSVSAGC